MERVLNEEEKIRRAEERYYGRRSVDISMEERSKVSFGLLKKIFVQLVLCFFIYVSIYFIQTKNFVFSNYVLDKTQYMLNYDIDVKNLKDLTVNFFNEKVLSFLKIKKEELNNYTNTEEINVVENFDDVDNNSITNTEQTNNENTINALLEDSSSISQMEDDAEYIKANFVIMKPLIGTITSRFGLRTPSVSTVPPYHTGIDIAVNSGTVFVAAMSGTVEQVSTQGDYRKSF